MRAGCGHTEPYTALPPPMEKFTTHKDINRDVSRSQDHDRLHWTMQIWLLKVTAGHADTHARAEFAQPRPNAHTLPARVRNWAKGPGKAGGIRMWGTGGGGQGF